MSQSDVQNAAGANPLTAPIQVADDIRRQREEQRRLEREAAAQREALAQLIASRQSPMPVADDEAVRRARRRSITAQLGRRGRASTMLSDPGSGGEALGS